MSTLSYKFTDLVDVQQLEQLLDLFYKATGLALAILDVDGTTYVARGWQDICTKFHRVNPHTCARCHESDAYINSRLGEGQYIEYRCKNGLWDMAAPIIIEGRHLANSYYGQVFLEEEKPDLAFFRKQAEEFGFDVEEYLVAVRKVPVISRQKARRIMDFYVGLVEFLANLGLTRSKQMKAEKSLRKSEERLRAIFEAAKNVSFIITDAQDTETLVLEFSPGAEKIFGYKRSDMIGNPISILHLPEDTARFPEAHRKMREGRAGFAGETVLIRKSGEKFPALFSTYPLLDEKGNMYAALGVSIDISEQKRLEEQLQKARKMEAMGLMAGGIAHDLNNILSGIVSYPDLLLMDLPEDSKLRRPIETIKESGQRAASVISDLLTVARGAASSKEVLNLNTMVKEYLRSAEHKTLETRYSSVTYKTQLDFDLLNVSCSPAHIKKALMNLVQNSSEDISGEGSVVISTRNQYVDKRLKGYDDVRIGEYAVIAISDNGHGISPQDLGRIFEPFFTKKVMGRSGTGLGLTVVWNTVQDHDGYINVRSGEEGTIFELYFPITRDEVTAEEKPIPLENYVGRGERILVVDDEENQREIACGLLTKLGYSSEAVSSGEEAIEYLKEHSADLIVLDMIMPKGINGRETYEEIIKIYPNQKAIIASGFSESEDVKAAQKLGAGQYVKKPYTLQKIGIAIKRELEKQQF